MFNLINFLFQQANCVLEVTCPPTDFFDIFRFYQEYYGIPNAAVLGIMLSIIVGPIVVSTRSLAHLAVLGIYVVAIVSATWLADPFVAQQYITFLYIIALGITTMVVVLVLKVIKE